MEKVARKEIDYWQTDFVKIEDESVTIRTSKNNFNPFRNKLNQRRNIFIVDWQVCDEEHLA